MKTFYEKERARVMAKFPSIDPASEEYGRLLFHIERLDTLIRWAAEDASYGRATPPPPPEEIPGQMTVEELPKEESAPVAEETPLPWVDATPFPDPKPQTELTKEYVRGLLRDATAKGITIAPILQQFVPEGKPFKFSEVPASSYAKLVEVLNNAG